MESLFFLLFFAILGVLIGRMFYKLYLGTIPEPSEEGLIFKERSGGSVSMDTTGIYLHLTKPFVTLHIYDDKVLLNYSGQKINLPYSNITKVDGFHVPLFYNGIRIHHNSPNQPIFIRFWSGKSKKIKKLIEERMIQTAQ